MDNKLLPEQFFGLMEKKKRMLREQIPWSRYLREMAAKVKPSEKLPPALEEVTPEEIKPVPTFFPYPTRLRDDYEQRRQGVFSLREEEIEKRRRMERIRRTLGEKQSFFNVKHTID